LLLREAFDSYSCAGLLDFHFKSLFGNRRDTSKEFKIGHVPGDLPKKLFGLRDAII
jgi:hypothetical protein